MMYKPKSLQEKLNELPANRRKKIQARTKAIEAEYLTLQELRKTAGLTQSGLSKDMKMPQPNLSRLEKNSDMLLSTLRNYVEAVGGKLNLTVELPDHAPISLSGLGDIVPHSNSQDDPRQ